MRNRPPSGMHRFVFRSRDRCDRHARSVERGQRLRVLVERTVEHADQAAAVFDFDVGKRLEGERLQVADVAAVRRGQLRAAGKRGQMLRRFAGQNACLRRLAAYRLLSRGIGVGDLTSRGFPTDFPVVGYMGLHSWHQQRRGFPTDFPVVGWSPRRRRRRSRRGFPTDFPVVGWP